MFENRFLTISVYYAGAPCTHDGIQLPPGAPPPPRPDAEGSWDPFKNGTEFRVADFLYRKVEMSARDVDELMELWAMSLEEHGIEDACGPFESVEELYATIGAIKVGDTPWKSFSVSHMGAVEPGTPDWQLADYEVVYRDPDIAIRNLLDNPDFDGQFDYAPYVQVDKDGQ